MTLQSPIAYSRREAPTRSLRSVEYDLLAQVTQRLKTAWMNQTTDFPSLMQALTDNQRLWSTLASDVALPGNQLPQALRARLFYLSEFVRNHSRSVMNDGASVEVLTDINTAVMRGLRGDRGAG